MHQVRGLAAERAVAEGVHEDDAEYARTIARVQNMSGMKCKNVRKLPLVDYVRTQVLRNNAGRAIWG